MSFAFTKQFSIALFATALTSPVFADTATEINSSNELVREQRFDEAIVGYRAVTPTDNVKDDLNYNLAVAEYRKGDIETAKAMLTDAATSPDSKIAAAARYNLGNCFYSSAVTAADKDKPAAIESLRMAIGHYRASLAGNPNNVDARANIELAVELLKKLQQQNKEKQQKEQQQQQQNQKQDQQDQGQQKDQQNPSKQDQQQQGQRGQESESSSDKPQADQQQQNQQKQENQGQGSQSKEEKSGQERRSDQDKSKSDKQQAEEGQRSGQEPAKEESGQSQQSKDQPNEDVQPKADAASQKQPTDQQHRPKPQQTGSSKSTEQQSNNQQKGDLGEGQQSELSDQPQNNADVPVGELKAANEQDSNENQKGRVAVVDPNVQEGLMSKEEALKMLQAVRDRDMLRRLRQERNERSRHVRTDRDW